MREKVEAFRTLPQKVAILQRFLMTIASITMSSHHYKQFHRIYIQINPPLWSANNSLDMLKDRTDDMPTKVFKTYVVSQTKSIGCKTITDDI